MSKLHNPTTHKTLLSEKLRLDMFGASADLPRIVEIDLSRIHANPNQPRKHFDPVSLQELVVPAKFNSSADSPSAQLV